MKKKQKKTNKHVETLALHAGHTPDSVTGARAVPVYMTTSYVFKNVKHASDLFSLKEFGYIYSRLQNPTADVVEKRIAEMEGGTGALLTSSGMSAIFLAIHTIAGNGDHIISSSSLYGGTDTLFRYTFPRIGISVSFLDKITPDNFVSAIKSNTKCVYFETLGNPAGDVPDISAIAKAAHKHGIPVIADNTFTPILCQPIKHGVDIVIHSCTKWIGGHGTAIGGVIVDSGNFNWASGRFPDFVEPDPSYHGLKYWDVFHDVPGLGNVAFIVKARVQGMRNIGMCPSPFNAFLFLQGIETLPIRIRQQCENTMHLAKWLSEHPYVSWVNYTGLSGHPYRRMAKKYFSGWFGSVFGFGIKGGYKSAIKFIESVELTSHLANVGDAKTLVLHPASTSHSQIPEESLTKLGITPDFIRVSVGIENIEDIKADFDHALRIAVRK